LFFDEESGDALRLDDSEPTDEQMRLLHKTIAVVDEDTKNLRFNTAIARMTEFVNEMTTSPTKPRKVMEAFVLLFAPYAPHLAEEIWERLGHQESLLWHPFPEHEEEWLVEDTVEIPVQVNGKVRARLNVPTEIEEEKIRELAFAEEKVQTHIAGKEVVKFIYVSGRMVTIAVKG